MTVKLLSYLGVGKIDEKEKGYKPYIYHFGSRSSSKTPFIQKALIELLQDTPQSPEEVYIFLTPLAREKSWEGNENLKEQLKELQSQFSFRFKPVDILGGQSIEEIWQDFETVFRVLSPGDEVIFDITHSFRYQPMMALLILHFARITKNVSVRGIYYGNINGPSAQVVDLTSFADLQDWITNVYAFTETGRADALYRWVQEKRAAAAKSKENVQDILPIENLVKGWVELTAAIQSCRGPLITDKAKQARKKLEEFRDSGKMKPGFQPILTLLERVDEQIRPIEEEDLVIGGLGAIEWCMRHGLTQQTFTLMNELVITAVCQREGYSYQNVREREEVSKIIHFATKIQNKQLPADAEQTNREMVDRLLQHPQMLKLYHEISDYRNDFNHAGWRPDPKKAETLQNYLNKSYPEFRKAILAYWEQKKMQN